MTCQTCEGDGHVGGWVTAKPCPNCDGEPEVSPVLDKDAQGCAAVIVAFAVLCAIGLAACVWQAAATYYGGV